MNALIIARVTFEEARQRRLLWAVAVLGIVFLVVFGIGFYHMYRDVSARAGDKLSEATNVLLMMGLYVVNFLVVMLAVITSAGSIAGEVSSGTIQTVVTKPIHRRDVVLGKWLGLAGLLSVFTLAMVASLMTIVWSIARYVPPNPLSGTALMVLEGWVILSVSALGGARLSIMVNGIVVFMLYGVAFIGGWIRQMGALADNQTAMSIGAVVRYLIPSEAVWKRAAYLMQPPFLRDLPVSPFAAVAPPGRGVILYAFAYCAVAVTLACYVFERRDL